MCVVCILITYGSHESTVTKDNIGLFVLWTQSFPRCFVLMGDHGHWKFGI